MQNTNSWVKNAACAAPRAADEGMRKKFKAILRQSAKADMTIMTIIFPAAVSKVPVGYCSEKSQADATVQGSTTDASDM